MEFLLELFLEVYLGFAEVLVPEHKLKKWQAVLLQVACVIVSLLILALIIAGIGLLTGTPKRTLGIVLLVVGCVLFVTQITLYVISFRKQLKKEKAEKQLPLINIDDTNTSDN